MLRLGLLTLELSAPRGMRRDHVPDVKGGQPRHRSACHFPLHSQGPAGTVARALGPRRTARPVEARRYAAKLALSAGDCSGLARGSLSAAFPPPRAPQPWRPQCGSGARPRCPPKVGWDRLSAGLPVPLRALFRLPQRGRPGRWREVAPPPSRPPPPPARPSWPFVGCPVGRAGRVWWLVSAGVGLEIVNNPPAVTPPLHSGIAEM